MPDMALSDDENTIPIDLSPQIQKRLEPTEVIRHLGEGGMGEVFLCVNPHYREGAENIPREVAVKTLSPELNQDNELLRRFEAEARALSPIEHRNVVRLYDWGVFQSGDKAGQHYISMEFIQGISLHRLARTRRLSFPDLIDFSVQIAEGLAAVHRSNVLHRDLKPANVMVTTDGVVKIIDFGIAKPTSLAGEAESSDRGFKTKTGIIIGTVNYLAPEMLLGAPATVQTDLYAVGLIIWEALNGATPFKSSSLAETMKKVSEQNLSWAESVIDIAPPGFIKLMNQLTAKDPAKRPQTAEELTERLRKIQADAKWPSALNRRTRLDLGFNWAQETYDLLHAKAVSEDEFPYVLQCVEDLLIRNKDSRLKTTSSIVIEDTILTQALQAFHSARYEAAMARQARLKADLTSVERTRQTAAQPAPANTALGRPPAKPLTIDPSEISRQIQATNQTKVAKPSTENGHFGLRIALGIILIAVVSVGSFYFIKNMRHHFESAELASSGQLPEVEVPNSRSQSRILAAFTAWKPGTKLIYEAEVSSSGAAKREVQERIEISKIENGRVYFRLEDGRETSMNMMAIPLDSVFVPFFGRDPSTKERSDLGEPQELTQKHGFALDFSSQDGSTRDRTYCQVISKSAIKLFGRDQQAIELNCNREGFKNGQITHRSQERYKFASGSGVMIETTSKIDAFDKNGALTSTTNKSSRLNEILSYVRSI